MGRLVLVSIGVLAAVFAASSRAGDPPSLKGTWVRESMVGPAMGNQVILTFTDHRVTARFRSGGRDPGGHEGWITLKFEGEYARTDSGLLVGTITGMNVDLSQIPEGDSPGEPLGKSVAKMIGEPFCFRARVSDGALTVTDLKVPNVPIDGETSSREMIAGFASGKYESSPTENVPVPKLKAAKAVEFSRTKLANNITAFMWLMTRPRSIFSSQTELPTPDYLKHNPEYYTPEPGQLPSMMPSPMPLPGPMAMPYPVPMAPQPVPMVVPASAMPIQIAPDARAEQLMFQGFDSGPPGAVPPKVFPANIERVEGGIMDDNKPSRETVIREIDLGEAGTMQVIVRMKSDSMKRMMHIPNAASQPMSTSGSTPILGSMAFPIPPLPGPTFRFDMGGVFDQPKPTAILPTAGQLLPPGSMRNVPVMPAIADAWKQSTAPVVK